MAQARRALAVLLVLLAVGCAALPALAQDAPETLIRRFLQAVLSADPAALELTILPCPGSSSLLEQSRAEHPELDDLAPRQMSPATLQARPVEGEPPIGSRAIWTAGFRGELLVLPLQRTPEGWRVDVRYCVAARRPVDPEGPEVAARKFVFYLVGRDAEKIAEVATVPPPLPGDPEFEDQYYALAQEMPVAPARAGETLALPDGSTVTVPEPTPDHAWYLGLYGIAEVPFELVRQDGAWKVVGRDYLPCLEGL